MLPIQHALELDDIGKLEYQIKKRWEVSNREIYAMREAGQLIQRIYEIDPEAGARIRCKWGFHQWEETLEEWKEGETQQEMKCAVCGAKGIAYKMTDEQRKALDSGDANLIKKAFEE